MATFSDFKLNRQLLDAVVEKGYTKPTPIQEKAIPRILAGQDVIGVAQTGTGKTAAFLLPTLMKLKYAQGDNPRALILAPTRELCSQISQEFEQLATNLDLRHACIVGGKAISVQAKQVAQGVDVLIATPARAMDVYLYGGFTLRQVEVMILDEADKMMDMGFMPQIRRLLEVVPTKRQNLLFSATFPPKVNRLAEEFLEFPEKIAVTPQATPAQTVAQELYYVPNFRTKVALLEHLLQDQETYAKVIVFVRRRQTANNLFKFISRKVADDCRVIHANKDQNTRMNAMRQFKEGSIRVLVSTDVASRGIDVTMVSHVINFDVPLVHEDYVHRIGRTGRAEQKGTAITFCNPAEKYHIKKIERVISMKISVAMLPTEVEIFETPKEEKQQMDREIDEQRKKEDPTFRGAFHEKKKKSSGNKRKGNKGAKPSKKAGNRRRRR